MKSQIEASASLVRSYCLVSTICCVRSGPVVAMVWEGKQSVVTGRKIVGATNPLQSEPGTVRGDFCIDVGRNLIHGALSLELACSLCWVQQLRSQAALWCMLHILLFALPENVQCQDCEPHSLGYHGVHS